MNKPGLWMMCIACAALAACGGDDDGGVSVAESHEVPAAASQSAQSMVGWIGELARNESSETKEALDLAKFAPPSAEDTEPLALQ